MIGCECAVCQSTDPRDQRFRTSIVVESARGTVLLVDTTPDLRMQALRQRMRRLDAVLFTHAHADHIAGLDDVRRFNAVMQRAMPVYGDASTLAEIRQRFSYIFDPETPRGGGLPEIRLWTLSGGPFCIDDLEVVPVPLRHGSRQVFGFRLGSFAYLTDCNAIPDASLARLTGLQVLVLDALRTKPHPTHFSLPEAVEMARRIGAPQVYFTHMTHDLGHAATCAALPAGMALAHDGLSIDIK